MTSKDARQNPFFIRNDYASDNKWGIPFIHRDLIDLNNLSLMPVNNVKSNDKYNYDKCIHFFADDYHIDRYYTEPQVHLARLMQYKTVCTPDYSLYIDMPLALQISNVFRNRWCGAYWQEYGVKVIPTVSWGTKQSYEFCFCGVERGSVVAISTVGARKSKNKFLNGYEKMMSIIEPQVVICLGIPFPEMKDNTLWVDYLETTRRAG